MGSLVEEECASVHRAPVLTGRIGMTLEIIGDWKEDFQGPLWLSKFYIIDIVHNLLCDHKHVTS